MKKLILFLLLIVNGLWAQDFSGRWQGHFSFFEITDVVLAQDKIFVSSQNAVYSYDLLTNEVETITTIEGLSGQIISALHYSVAFNKLLIGYANGLMEVYDPTTRDIRTVVDIIDKQTIPPNQKRVNNFFESGNIVIVACQFGVVEYNIERLEFGDTFFIGSGGTNIDVKQVAVANGKIFAATAGEGIKTADANDPNLIDSTRWTTVIGGTWNGLTVFNNTLFAVGSNRQLWRYNGTGFSNTGFVHPNTFSRLRAGETFMTLTTNREVFVFNTGETVAFQLVNFQNNRFVFTVANATDNLLFAGTTEGGLLKFNLPDLTTPEVIAPNGPLRNDPFYVQAAPNELWAVYGIYSFSYNPSPLSFRGVSHLVDNEWLNIPVNDPDNPDADLDNAPELVFVNISPFDNRVYLSSFFSGIYILENNQLVERWDNSNSGLETLLPGRVDIRIHDTRFDRDGNLWVTNSRIENGLKVRRPGGQWENVSLAEVVQPTPDISGPDNPFLGSDLGYSNMVIDQNGTKWIATERHGVIGYNEKSPGVKLKNIDEENGGNLPIDDVRALAVDRRNSLWIGTRSGLRVLFNTGGFFQEERPRAEEIIILQNGVPEELLQGQFVSDIEVDGSDNKWIATGGSGVFQLSPDGQRTLQRFTTDNSPLPSNGVNDISIDNTTGRVYFATDRGLVSFLGTATGTTEDLNDIIVFPNPVKPDFNGNLTIRNLTPRAKVKITDISGNLVFETIAQGGSIEWDLRAFGRYKVASGVYMIIITDRDGQNTKVEKVMVIR